jgi:hypothetical protein
MMAHCFTKGRILHADFANNFSLLNKLSSAGELNGKPWCCMLRWLAFERPFYQLINKVTRAFFIFFIFPLSREGRKPIFILRLRLLHPRNFNVQSCIPPQDKRWAVLEVLLFLERFSTVHVRKSSACLANLLAQ